MRRESHALRMLHLQVRMVLRNRFLNEDIDTGSGDDSIIDCLSKILLNDDRSPSYIYKICRRLHQSKLLLANQSVCPFVKRRMYGHDVRDLQQLLERKAWIVLAMARARC